jgi:hypothetical protein
MENIASSVKILPRHPPEEARKNAKSRRFPGEQQLQRPMKPKPPNAWTALRDGAICSERLW